MVASVAVCHAPVVCGNENGLTATNQLLIQRLNIMSKKPVRYCEHIRKGLMRSYARVIGSQYDLVICWKCQQEGGQFLAQAQDLMNRLKKLVDK